MYGPRTLSAAGGPSSLEGSMPTIDFSPIVGPLGNAVGSRDAHLEGEDDDDDDVPVSNAHAA